jgi:hypothetical protein
MRRNQAQRVYPMSTAIATYMPETTPTCSSMLCLAAVSQMQRKETPYCYLDMQTAALYDLQVRRLAKRANTWME